MKKSIKYLIVFLLCVIFCTNGVKAKSYNKDLFQADQNLKVTEEIDGTAFLAGQKITVQNKINGIGFVAGETVNINYDQEYIFAAGSSINIEANVEKEAFLAAADINVKGNLGRDSYMAADTITIDGNSERNINLSGSTVELNGEFKGNVTVDALDIKIGKDAKIAGTLKYNEDANIVGLDKTTKTKTYRNVSTQETFKDYIMNFINSYIHIALFAVVLIFLFEAMLIKSLDQTKELSAKNIIGLCGKGFLILIGVPIIAFMLLISGIFISVGVVGGLAYGILVYTAKIFTAYFIAKLLDEKLFKKNLNSYLLAIIGLFIINVITLIPGIGALISFISLLLGLGIAGNMIIELKNK